MSDQSMNLGGLLKKVFGKPSKPAQDKEKKAKKGALLIIMMGKKKK